MRFIRVGVLCALRVLDTGAGTNLKCRRAKPVDPTGSELRGRVGLSRMVQRSVNWWSQQTPGL
jgi:hypothetical protein